MKLKRTFVGSKMNKDMDERLLPAGEYPHAENIRVASTDASDVGAVENVKGNYPLTDFNLTNAVTIGALSDDATHKIYWFTTSDEKDMVVEHDMLNSITTVLLESSKPNGVLNFSRNHLITGVFKVTNGDSNKDLLVWTDDLNAPRMINIERVKNFEPDGFEEDDISLIKKPPRFAPKVQPTFTTTSLENNLEDKFISFAYRYKYLDGEYSALSSFTNYKFASGKFKLDYQTMENEGMINAHNAYKIEFDTGDHRVTDIEVVYKESNSNTVFLIERFTKKKESWGDGETKSFVFSNSKKYIALPQDELYRAYDNVPRRAKAAEMIGNRVVFGNYVEGYNMIDNFGQDVYVDYGVSMVNEEIVEVVFPTTMEGFDMSIDTEGAELKNKSSIVFGISMRGASSDGSYGNYVGNLTYVLNKDYDNLAELVADQEFVDFVTIVMTNDFKGRYSAELPQHFEVVEVTPFEVSVINGNILKLTAPIIKYKVNTVPPRQGTMYWVFNEESTADMRDMYSANSLKTNRSYEVGIIYMDEYGRRSTVLTEVGNTIYLPQEYSTYRNKLIVDVNHNPPYWADRYKLVVKQNKEEYHTIYCNRFYNDGLYRWVSLEGANKDKVREGDTLIVKSDLGGAVRDLTKVRVLEVTQKEANFIDRGAIEEEEKVLEEPAGLYMKIKPSGFYMSNTEMTQQVFEGSSHVRYPRRVWTQGKFGRTEDGVYENYSLPAGSSIKIYIEFKARGSISYHEEYSKDFVISEDYESVKDWFVAEVKNLGDFGKDFTWNGEDWIGNEIEKDSPYGSGNSWNEGSGWGWKEDGSQFFVVPHRRGTASRNITTVVRFEIMFSEGTVIFETEASDSPSETFYETEQTFEIIDGKHKGNIQDQTLHDPAIIEMDFFNCYAQGNGAESYRYKDLFNKNFLNIDLRPAIASVEPYREVRRYADLTYSSPYNDNNNINGLNEFNLSRINYKEDIDKKYGFIQKLHSRDTDLLVFQEDKVSKVLYGKDLLMNADGSSNLSAIEDVLGQQVTYKGEYGISNNPESFQFDGHNIYFTDAKRGVALRLSEAGIHEISAFGMNQFFKDSFRETENTKKVGGIDPYYDEYVIHVDDEGANPPVKMDCSGKISRSKFKGFMEIEVDYGLSIGKAGITFATNGIPVKISVIWDGVVRELGYVGDHKYNEDLIEMGLPPVVGRKNGNFSFDKTKMMPNIAKYIIESPIGGAAFTIEGRCINVSEKRVITVVTNTKDYEGEASVNRFKWIRDGYSSSNKTINTLFTKGEVSNYETMIGKQGEGFIPLNGSTIMMESFSEHGADPAFRRGGRFGYLLSNTLYSESEIASKKGLFRFTPITETTKLNGDVIYSTQFELPQIIHHEYIYLMYDYQEPLVANDDQYTVQSGKIISFDVRSNDETLGLDCDVILESDTFNGLLTKGADNLITYEHYGAIQSVDTFKYKLKYGDRESNLATVTIRTPIKS